MPAIVLGAGLSAVVMRQMRSAMLDSLGADYVRTARAKGLSERSVVGKHALRNSLITVTTIIGLQLGALISGAVITEQIFGIAGFGRLTIDAVNQRDYALHPGGGARRRDRLRRRQPARRRRVLAPEPAHPHRREAVVTVVEDAAIDLASPRARRRRRAPEAARPAAGRDPRLRGRDHVHPRRDPRAGDRAVLALGDGLRRAARAAVLGPPARARTSSDATSSRGSSGAPARRSRRRARDLPRDGDRRADRARRRLLPRLGRPGDLARDRRRARLPVPDPRRRARRDPRPVAAERHDRARRRRRSGVRPRRARRDARAARGGLRPRGGRERRGRCERSSSDTSFPT